MKNINIIRMRKILLVLSFCFVGGTSALVWMIAFNIFFWLGLNFIVCQIFAFPISIIYNFFMNRNITFSAKRNPIKRQIFRWIIVYTISIGVNLLISVLVVNLLGENTLNANIAVICGIAVSIPISFFGSLLWTFKKEEKNNKKYS